MTSRITTVDFVCMSSGRTCCYILHDEGLPRIQRNFARAAYGKKAFINSFVFMARRGTAFDSTHDFALHDSGSYALPHLIAIY